VVVVWLWLTSIALLAGAKLNAEIERSKESTRACRRRTRSAGRRGRHESVPSAVAWHRGRSAVRIHQGLRPCRDGPSPDWLFSSPTCPSSPCLLARTRRSSEPRELDE
jgi:hypothetical protein